MLVELEKYKIRFSILMNIENGKTEAETIYFKLLNDYPNNEFIMVADNVKYYVLEKKSPEEMPTEFTD